MIPVDRQTLTLIAVIVCMVGLVLMFKELRTAKEDVEGLKGFSMNVMKRMQAPPQPVRVKMAPAPAPPTKEEEKEEGEIIEEKSED
jgi:hypothetical protein